VITPDGKTMIIGETMAKRLTAFDIAADGTLSNRRCGRDANCNPTHLPRRRGASGDRAFTHHMVRVLEGGKVSHDSI